MGTLATSEYPAEMPQNVLPNILLFCLFDFILYVPSTIFQLNREGSSRVEQVLS